MSVTIGVLRESAPQETRVALVPEVADKLVAPRMGLSADQKILLLRAMPQLKARATTLDQLADGACFLFTQRPLNVDKAAATLAWRRTIDFLKKNLA